jgi:iron-sulfur cluster assembly accessory protein
MTGGITISITKKAFFHILEKKKEKKVGVKIYREWSGCCGTRYVASLEEAPEDDDVVFGVNGIKIYISKYLAEFMDEVEIDYDEDMGGELLIRVPAPRCEGGAC